MERQIRWILGCLDDTDFLFGENRSEVNAILSGEIYLTFPISIFHLGDTDDSELRLNFNCFASPEANRVENDIFTVSLLFAVINSAFIASHFVYRARFI